MSENILHKAQNIWYISKYAKAPMFGNPTRQFFYSKYMGRKGRNLTLISSRSSRVQLPANIQLKNQHEYECDGVRGILLDGPDIDYGFNYKRIWSWILFELRLLKWCYFENKEKPDAIIVSSLSILTFLSGVIMKNKFKCKLIVEVRDIWPLTIIESKGWSRKNPFIAFLAWIEKKGYKNADAIIGTMPNLKEHVKNVLPGAETKVHYQPMGYDPEFSYGVSDKPDNYAEFFKNLGDEKFIVGYAGSIGITNCVDQIVEAARILADTNIVFALLGDGPLKPKVLKKVEEYDLTNIYFYDKVPKNHVGVFLKYPHMLIHAWKGGNTLYRYGVSPNKWIDYMHSAKPILVALDGYPCIINEANCGKFIPADNPQLLAEGILEFSKKDRKELEAMGTRGKKYLQEKLSYEVLATSYLKIIDNLFKPRQVG